MSVRASRNNRIAGLFVILATIGALATLTMVGGGLERLGKKPISARFTIESGAASLSPGSAVTLGGIKIGTVTSVKHVDDFSAIEVRMSIDSDVPLRSDAEARLVPPLLGGSGVINFQSVGGEDAAMLAKGGTVNGISGGLPFDIGSALEGIDLSAAVGDLNLGQLLKGYTLYDFLGETPGDTDGLVATTKNSIASIGAAADDVGSSSRNFDTFIGPTVAEAAENFSELSEGAVRNIDVWTLRVDNILRDVETAASGAPHAIDNINSGAESAGRVLNEIEKVATADNVDRINRSIENVDLAADDIEAFAASIGEDGGDLNQRLAAFLTNGNETLRDAQSILTTAQFRSDEILADLALTAVQLRDTSLELRRSPWRLVYRPTDNELNFEMLYDAARTYAGAVADLRTTSAALKAAVGSDLEGATPQDLERIRSLIQRAEQATEKYRGAEGQFLDLLRQNADNVSEE